MSRRDGVISGQNIKPDVRIECFWLKRDWRRAWLRKRRVPVYTQWHRIPPEER